MKYYKIYLPLSIAILIIFVCLNSFDKKENHQDCQGYLVSKNNDLRHVPGVPNAIINPYQTCVNGLQPLGKRRKFMVDSYVNLLEYYQGNQQTFKYYKQALHQETAR
ncbi:MAG: hypothetical protein ABIO55_04550 [Ginsengibacter sp.]